jgi:hypothetical protein
MKIAMRLTLDDLVRTLRGKAHRMAEELETGYSRLAVATAGETSERTAKGERDDVGSA